MATTRSDDKVKLNVGGRIFVTSRQTLATLDNHRLSNLSPADANYDDVTAEYFFDRNAAIFEYILDVFRKKQLHLPKNLCGSVIKEELAYWGIPSSHIAHCCWHSYVQWDEESEQISMVERTLNGRDMLEALGRVLKAPNCSRFTKWRMRLWYFLEEPRSSAAAGIWALVFVMVIIASVAAQTMITHPIFREKLTSPRGNTSNITNPKLIMYLTTDAHRVLPLTENICLVIFTAELLLRFIVSPQKCVFLKNCYNIVDMAAITPMWLIFVFDSALPHYYVNESLFQLAFIWSILGVFRIIKLIKYARYYSSVRIMLLALKASFKEVLLLLLLIAIGTLIFSTLIYYAEFYQRDTFENIPTGFWWSIVTMTTVGYGDKHPTTGWGYLVGALCAICGMLSTGLPIPIIASNFNLYYGYAKASSRAARRFEARPKGKLESCVSVMGCALNGTVQSPNSTIKPPVNANRKLQSCRIIKEGCDNPALDQSDIITKL